MTNRFYYDHGLIVVTAYLTGTKRKSFSVMLALDTGSTLTIISPGILEKVGVDFDGHSTILHGINEKVDAPLAKLKLIEIAGAVNKDLLVASHQLATGYPIDGVIGNSFFLNYQLTINFPNQTISINEN